MAKSTILASSIAENIKMSYVQSFYRLYVNSKSTHNIGKAIFYVFSRLHKIKKKLQTVK